MAGHGIKGQVRTVSQHYCRAVLASPPQGQRECHTQAKDRQTR